MSIRDILAILTLLAIIYPIYQSLSPFVGNKIILNIFDEISNSENIKKILSNKIIYIAIYIIAVILFPFVYNIPHMILILLEIIIVSTFIIIGLIIFYYYHNKKLKIYKIQNNKHYKINILSYKTSNFMFFMFILLFIFILLISIGHLPYISFFSIYFFLLYWHHYLFVVFASLYFLVFSCELLFFNIRQKKYRIINYCLNREGGQLWIEVILKNGGKISGQLDNISHGFMQLNSKKTIYKINYRQIDVIGCKYYPIYKQSDAD